MALVVAVFLQMGFVSVTSTECFSSGKEKVFLGEKKSCCASEPPAATETVAPQCCDVLITSATFHTYKPSQDYGLDMDMSATASFVSQKSFSIPEAFFQRFVQVHLKVPPISGRDILIYICKYTI